VPDISYPSIPDPNLDPGAMLNTLTRLKETVELITGQSKDHRFSFPNQVRIVERRSATSSARFTESLQIQANSIEAVVIRTTTLEADMGQAQADIVNEQTVRATADTALATSITTVQANVDTVDARVTTEQTARATADTALATSITNVQTNIDNVAADVNTETTARIAGDTANATAITNVEVKANGATASGQVYLKSETAPGGYTSRYGWYLNVTGLPSIGMDALLTTGGTGEIAFTASKFKLVDPSYLGGAPHEVFTYNGTTFNFGVPVTVLNEEIGANAVSNTVAASGNVADCTRRGTGAGTCCAHRCLGNALRGFVPRQLFHAVLRGLC
jgi:hypothetical protein